MINSYFVSSATHRMVTYPVNISHSSRQLTSNGIQVWIMLMIASELNARANKLWVTGGTQVELRWGKKCLVNSILIYGLEFIIRGQRSLINSRQRKFQSRQWLWVLNNWLTFVDLYDHRVGLVCLPDRSILHLGWDGLSTSNSKIPHSALNDANLFSFTSLHSLSHLSNSSIRDHPPARDCCAASGLDEIVTNRGNDQTLRKLTYNYHKFVREIFLSEIERRNGIRV